MGEKFELVLARKGSASERYPVSAEGLYIGRGEDNDITLRDQLVSRRHARVWSEDGAVRVEDLDSRNGIQVNGEAARSATLREGDVLKVGEAVLRVAGASESTFGKTILEPARAAEIFHRMVNERTDSPLPVLYRAAQLLGTVFDQDELLERILELIFDALPARRGYVLTAERGAKDPVIHASRTLDDKEEGPPYSHTLVKQVFQTSESMLTLDAQQEISADEAPSIHEFEIHSAMCVPLCGRERTIGVIYVDSGGVARAFTDEQLELLSAIGRVVGVAVENARLYRENVEKEKLAAIGVATAGLGHCVKNILTGIRGGAEFINMALDKDDVGYLRKGWPILSQAIDRIDMLMNNMLSFSKDRVPQRSPTDIHALVEEVLGTLRARAQRYQIELRAEPWGNARGNVDARELYRVLLNLIGNSVDACIGEGGVVTVSSGVDEDGLHIVVSDNGCGISEELLPRLSEAFVSTKGSSGTGLGLACSYKIIREHGGHIDCESELGKGTRFSIVIPHEPREEIPTRRVVID